MTEQPEFLIRLDAKNFFTNLGENGMPFGTPYPSYAAHMEYEAADSMCSKLRALGFGVALVTDVYGQPITAADLARFRNEARSYVQNALAELNLSIAELHGFQHSSPLTQWELEDVLAGNRVLSEYESENLVSLCRELRRFYNSFGGNVDWVQDKTMIASILQQEQHP